MLLSSCVPACLPAYTLRFTAYDEQRPLYPAPVPPHLPVSQPGCPWTTLFALQPSPVGGSALLPDLEVRWISFLLLIVTLRSLSLLLKPLLLTLNFMSSGHVNHYPSTGHRKSLFNSELLPPSDLTYLIMSYLGDFSMVQMALLTPQPLGPLNCSFLRIFPLLSL